jgi:hypothetical protein
MTLTQRALLRQLKSRLITPEQSPETQAESLALYNEIKHALLHERPLDQPADIERARASELKGLEKLAAREDIRG